MKRLLLGLCLLGFATGADAKQLIIQKVGRDPGQLHQELLAAFPTWQAALNPATGRVEDPGLCRVEFTATQILITVPDGTDVAAVNAVIAAHVPKPPAPDPDVELGQAIAAVDTSQIADPAAKSALETLKNALIGKGNPSKVKGIRP